MNNVICMIPARMGSKRVPKKNIRLLGGKPLVAYAITAAKASGIFDEIYLNSEDAELIPLAQQYNIKFYKRPASLATDEVQNDDFAADFLSNVPCQTMIQLLPTCPFITPEIIREFHQEMVIENHYTLVSVKNIQIECLYRGNPINFLKSEKTLPSQNLYPVEAYACGIMGWKSDWFLENYKFSGAAYHGGHKYVGYFPISGYATIDIDSEQDFQLAEQILKALKAPAKEPEYWTPNKKVIGIENDVPSILEKDGVIDNDLFDVNKEIVNIDTIIEDKISVKRLFSWSKRLVDTDSNSATLICQRKGDGNRRHLHNNWNEWWLILQGSWLFEIEGVSHVVHRGDFVLIEKNKVHKITALEDYSIRLAISRADVDHIYV